MPNFDNFHIRGYTHNICEDYSLSTEKSAVLSDGCSGAANSHLGALLLCENWVKHPESYLLRSQFIAEQLDYDEECLHATLGVIKPYKQPIFPFTECPEHDLNLCARLYGDGVIWDGKNIYLYDFIYKGENKNNLLKGSSVPFYPIYQQIKDWYCLDIEFSITNLITNEKIIKDQAHAGTDSYYGNKFVIFSDGVSSFIDSDNKKIPTLDIVQYLTDFKITKGDFVKRRALKCFKTIFPDLGWRHLDDVSIIGGICE